MTLRQNTRAAVNPLTYLNDPAEAFKNPIQLSFMRTLVDALRLVTEDVVSRNTATSHFILLSPNGTAYRVTVADDGTLTTENARG